MAPSRRLKAPELLRPRLAVLTAGLLRLEKGEAEGAGTIRRMGKVFLTWAIGEELEEVEKAAFDVVRAPDSELVQAGSILRNRLKEIVSGLGPEPSQHFVVLAVEESPDDAALLELGLESPDRTLHIVATLAEAEEVLRREEVALLVLDLLSGGW